jgi:hypothetical protein
MSWERFESIGEHLPPNTKVLRSLNRGAYLLLDTGILKLEPKSMFREKTGFIGAKLIPFTDVAKVSVNESKLICFVEIKMHKNRGELRPFTKSSKNAHKFAELLLSMIPASAEKFKLRDDFAIALGAGEDYVPTDLDWTIESFIPSESKVIFLLKPGFLILLDNGVLVMKAQLFSSISGAELIPLAQIKGVTVTDRNPGAEYNPQYAVEVRGGTVNWVGLTESREEAFQFQDLLLGIMNSSAPTASYMKDLIEKLLSNSGKSPAEKLEELSNLRYQRLLSDQEFESAKAKILGI